jgi:hypothetical protein
VNYRSSSLREFLVLWFCRFCSDITHPQVTKPDSSFCAQKNTVQRAYPSADSVRIAHHTAEFIAIRTRHGEIDPEPRQRMLNEQLLHYSGFTPSFLKVSFVAM